MGKDLYADSEFMAEVIPCTFQEYKEKYDIKSNEYSDLERGYEVKHCYAGNFFIDELIASLLFGV